MVAQCGAEGRLEQVGGRVVLLYQAPSRDVDARLDARARLDDVARIGSDVHGALVARQHVHDLHRGAGDGQRPRVRHLSPGLRVERGLGEQ